MAKFEKPPMLRNSSCAYPKPLRSCSSRVAIEGSYHGMLVVHPTTQEAGGRAGSRFVDSVGTPKTKIKSVVLDRAQTRRTGR